MTFDVATLGEAMLRFSVPVGTRLEETDQLDVHVAGAEANTAIALAQLDRSVAWISRLPEGPLGRRVAGDLRARRVDISHVRWIPDSRMGTYFVELAVAPRPVGVVYDRADSAAAAMDVGDFPGELFGTARVVHLSGITPALSPSCHRLALDVAAQARSAECRLSVDINYRAKLWSAEAARACMTEMASGADLVVLTREDAKDVFGLTGEPSEIVAEARTMLDAEMVVLTLGEAGSIWNSPDGLGRVEAAPTEILDRLGAGDAFVAGLIDGILDGDLERGVRTGTVLASLALSSRGDHVVTTREEVDRLLTGAGRTVDR